VRSGVEGGFRFQSEQLEHGSNATGNNPNSPSRRDPEKASVQYKADCAALASDLIFAERNTKRPRGAPESPIEGYINALAREEGLFVPLEQERQRQLHWSLGPSFLCTLRRDDKGIVYLQAEQQKYSSEALMGWTGIGEYINDESKKLKLFVMDDASRAMACLKVRANGDAYEALCEVKIYGSRRWRASHTLLERWLTYQLPADLGNCVTNKGMAVGIAIAAALKLDSVENPSWLAFGLADICALRRQVQTVPAQTERDLPEDPKDRSEVPVVSPNSAVRLNVDGAGSPGHDDEYDAWTN